MERNQIGFTKAAGRTLVASGTKRHGTDLCSHECADWFQDTYKLMDYAYNQYENITVINGQRPIKVVRIWNGNKDFVFIGTKEDVICPIKKESESKISVEYVLPDDKKAPINRWQEAGHLKVYVNDNYLFSSPLYYMEDID